MVLTTGHFSSPPTHFIDKEIEALLSEFTHARAYSKELASQVLKPHVWLTSPRSQSPSHCHLPVPTQNCVITYTMLDRKRNSNDNFCRNSTQEENTVGVTQTKISREYFAQFFFFYKRNHFIMFMALRQKRTNWLSCLQPSGFQWAQGREICWRLFNVIQSHRSQVLIFLPYKQQEE